MAELSDLRLADPGASPCCPPAAQANCCEPTEKPGCCSLWERD